MNNSQQLIANKGFTLTELLVSIGIVFVILAVIVFNQSKYLDSIALANLADETSSMIFQAQSWSAGVKEFSPASGEFTASYGLTFNLLGSGSNVAYLFFADRNGNKIYDNDWSCPTGAQWECLEKINISRGNYIESLCVINNLPYSDHCSVGRADISFAYSDSKVQLMLYNTDGSLFNPNQQAIMKGAKIVFRSPGGLTRSIIVYTTGQVSVQTTSEGGTQ